MMDLPSAPLIPRPGPSLRSRRIGIATTKRRPPLCFKLGLEFARVERAQDIATHAFTILSDEAGLRREEGIGPGVDVAENLSVLIKTACILAAVAGLQTDAVEIVAISGAAGANLDVVGGNLTCSWTTATAMLACKSGKAIVA
jgi:hypothetical protein